jgi:PAS domain S-box-containing protein
MNEQGFKKEQLKKQIKEILEKNTHKEISKMGMSELVAEVSIYHQKLEYQNEELLRTQKQLEEAKAGYQSLFDNAPLGYVICAEDLSIINANKTFCNMVQNKSVKKTSLTDYISPASQDEFYLYFRKFIKHSELPHIEIELKSKSGVCPVIVDGNYYIEGEKKLYRFTFSKLKIAEMALRESEERFSIAFKSSPAPLVISDIITGLFVDVNNRWVEMLGYSRDELIGKTSKEVGIWMNPGERDRIVKLLVEDGSFKDQYIEFKTKSDALILALWSAEAIVVSGKKMMLSMISDITKQKEIEFELQRFNLNWELLTKAIGQINSVLEIETVMRQLVDSAIMITGAKEGTAGMVVDGKMVFNEYNRQGETFPVNYSFDLNVGVPGWVMASKEPYISNNALEDEHVVPEVQKKLGFYNLIDIPILNKRGRVIGCFEIHNKPDGFKEHDAILLKNLAVNAAVAIENSEEILQRKNAQEALEKFTGELEENVAEKTRELQERVELLERFHEATIDREFRIKELRTEIEQLKNTDKTDI